MGQDSVSESSGQGAVSTQGGAYIAGDVSAYGDFVSRDKIINQGELIIQQALSAVDEAQKAHALEEEMLAQGVNRYVQHLVAIITKESSRPKGGPYRGLVAYDLNDAEIFFGRDSAIQSLGIHLQRHKLTVIQSESGAGKSSLLKAGVAPRLFTSGHLPLIVRPYDLSPGIKIKQVFLSNLSNTPELAKTSLHDFLKRVTGILGDERGLFIILDQFEEFFTRLEDMKAREAFVNDLANCLEDVTLQVRWVLSLRSEFFGDLAGFRPRISNPFENDFRLNRLSVDEARQAIVDPALGYGIQYEAELVDRLLGDLAGSDNGIAPPQLQLVCLALYLAYLDVRQEDPTTPEVITQGIYESNGETRGILRNHLNRVLVRSFSEQNQRVWAREILVSLISSDKRRIRLPHSGLVRQLLPGADEEKDLESILPVLVDNRLINVEMDEEEPEAIYELAHDYLIGEIEVDPQTQARKLAEEILQQEVSILRQDRTQKHVIAERRLELVERYLPRGGLTEEEEYLLKHSRARIVQAEQSELQRVERELRTQKNLTWRTRLLLAIVSAVAVVLAAQPVWAIISRYRATNSVPMVEVGELGVAFESYEVTNQRYAWCVDYGDCNSPNDFVTVRENWERDRLKPVSRIAAADALNFCRWIEKTLPTAEEWLYVAPPVEQWAQLPEETALIPRDGAPVELEEVGRRTVPQFQNSTGDAGIYDLVGSVSEWTRTVITNDNNDTNVCEDVSEFKGDRSVVGLGDDWTTPREFVGKYGGADVSRSQYLSSNRFEGLGFRCVSVPQAVTQRRPCPSMEQ